MCNSCGSRSWSSPCCRSERHTVRWRATGPSTPQRRRESRFRKSAAGRIHSRPSAAKSRRADEMGPQISMVRWSALRFPRRATPSVIRLKHREERLLRDLDLAHLLHALLTRGLLGPELALAGDVAAVALRSHVFAHCSDRLARNNARPDRGL